MGWFGGSTESSSGLDLSSGGNSDYGSKLRSPSTELDLSDYPGDSTGLGGDSNSDIQLVLQKEQQKALLMSAIHKINDNCWDICVDSISSSLGRRTETCLANCSDRFVDTTLLITNRFAQLASKMQGGR